MPIRYYIYPINDIFLLKDPYKNGLGVISLTNQKSQDATLIGKISTGFPGSNLSQSQTKLPIPTNNSDVTIQSLKKEGSNVKTQIKST